MTEKDQVCPQCGTLLADREFRPVPVEGENAELTLKECPVCTALVLETPESVRGHVRWLAEQQTAAEVEGEEATKP